jgi:hypothetical protein
MEDSDQKRSQTSRSFKFLSFLHPCLFSLVVAFAVTFACYLDLTRGVTESLMGSWGRPSNYLWLWYFFIRAGLRVTGVFGHAPRREEVLSAGVLSAAFFTLVTMICVVLFLGFNAIGRTRVARLVVDPIAGIFLFTVFPLGVLLLPSEGVFDNSYTLWSTTLPLCLLVVAIVAGTVFLTRKWIISTWFLVPLTAYFMFFVWVYYGRYSWKTWGGEAPSKFLTVPFFVTFASAGIAWMFFAQAVRGGQAQIHGYPWTRLLAVTIPLFAVCCIPWLPARSHSVAHPKNMASVSIHLRRTGCFGRCRIYEITIHGDGTVKYEGKEFVRTKGPEITSISRETLTDLLQSFDRAGFSTIDDRAFGVCFDAPRTIITVSADGYTKSLNVDSCLGRSRPKADVLELGEKIDEVVGSRQWVECHGASCVWH